MVSGVSACAQTRQSYHAMKWYVRNTHERVISQPLLYSWQSCVQDGNIQTYSEVIGARQRVQKASYETRHSASDRPTEACANHELCIAHMHATISFNFQELCRTVSRDTQS